MSVALITGASRGLGRAIAHELASGGWHLVLDARDASALRESVRRLDERRVAAIDGDVTDARHRDTLVREVRRLGRLDLLVNNASHLGPSPQPRLAAYPLDAFARVYEVNVMAPLALTQVALPVLRQGARILAVSSDAGVEAYEGWGGYGSAKAALDQLSAVLAAEHPRLRIYAFDPGDMATDLQQQAFPGEDISDRPSPETVVGPLLELVEGVLPSGRYLAADLAERAAVATEPRTPPDSAA